MHLIDSILAAWQLLFSGDPALWRIIGLSFQTCLVSLVLASPFALLLAYAIASHRFAGRRLLIWLIQAALSMPTVLIGLILYTLLSRKGVLGPLHWLFDPAGIILGQICIVLPVLLAFSLSALQAVDPRYAETAKTLGASNWRIMCSVCYEVRFGLMAAMISGFGRIISEVGCAMMIGGNILDSTRTITTAIAFETSKGEFAQGIALGMVLMLLALLINGLMLLLQGDAHSLGMKS